MTDPQRTVPFAILRAGFAAFLLYGGPIAGILLVVPAAQIQGLGGFIDAASRYSPSTADPLPLTKPRP
jgi:hypothetical protein